MDAPFANGDGNNLLDILENDQIENTDAGLMQDSLKKEVQQALSALSLREAEVISSYYGLNDVQPMTLEEIGERFSLTRERVRQIKEKATKRLRYSSSSEVLKGYLG